MDRRKVVIAAVLVLLAGASGGWMYTSPMLALNDLKEAATAGDAERLEELVDFARLRDAVRDEVRDEFARGLGLDSAALHAPEARGFLDIIDASIDEIITPEAVATFATSETGREMIASAEGETENIRMTVERGINGFRATFDHQEVEEGGLTFVFERAGVGWRLVDFEVPDAIGAEAASALF